jgi:hypothetical protein
MAVDISSHALATKHDKPRPNRYHWRPGLIAEARLREDAPPASRPPQKRVIGGNAPGELEWSACQH